MFNFCLFALPNEVFLYFLYKMNCIIVEFVIDKRCTTLEMARDLNTVILPSKVNCLMRHNFNILSILRICLEKSLSYSRFLLYEKWTPSIFMVLLLRLTHFMQQSVTWTPFTIPIPTISHFLLLGFNPEIFEKIFNFINSIIEFLSLRKKCHLHKRCIKFMFKNV